MDLVGVREAVFWTMTPAEASHRLRVYRWSRRQEEQGRRELAAIMTAHVLAALTGKRVKPKDLLDPPRRQMSAAERQRKWDKFQERMKRMQEDPGDQE